MLGGIGSAMGSTVPFAAIASRGAAIGLGFLTRLEGLFIQIPVPAFAGAPCSPS